MNLIFQDPMSREAYLSYIYPSSQMLSSGSEIKDASIYYKFWELRLHTLSHFIFHFSSDFDTWHSSCSCMNRAAAFAVSASIRYWPVPPALFLQLHRQAGSCFYVLICEAGIAY